MAAAELAATVAGAAAEAAARAEVAVEGGPVPVAAAVLAATVAGAAEATAVAVLAATVAAAAEATTAAVAAAMKAEATGVLVAAVAGKAAVAGQPTAGRATPDLVQGEGAIPPKTKEKLPYGNKANTLNFPANAGASGPGTAESGTVQPGYCANGQFVHHS
jgi:hypothetical protein